MGFDILKDFMDRMTDSYVPGNVVSVWQENKEVFRYCSGYADLEQQIPMTDDRLFNIYSCSKVLTVTAAMQLLERGYYLLDDPISDFLPEFKDMQVKNESAELVPADKQITFRHLFTMTAGLSYDLDAPAFQKARELTQGRMDTVTVAKCLAVDPLHFQPGTRWNYSLCHDLLAAMVEVISGKRFRDYVQENIFDPIGMTESGFHITPEKRERMAQQYTRVPKDEAFDAVAAQSGSIGYLQGVCRNVGKENKLIPGPEYDSGGAGVITSVPDYAKFASTLANGGVAPNGERILGSGYIDLLRTNQLTAELVPFFTWKQHIGYGYGLGVRTLIDRSAASTGSSLGEFGWGGAAGATILVDPDRKLSCFYAMHLLDPREEYYQPRLRNCLYACL